MKLLNKWNKLLVILENGWPVQIRKSREIKHVTHGSNCPSKQSQGWRQEESVENALGCWHGSP